MCTCVQICMYVHVYPPLGGEEVGHDETAVVVDRNFLRCLELSHQAIDAVHNVVSSVRLRRPLHETRVEAVGDALDVRAVHPDADVLDRPQTRGRRELAPQCRPPFFNLNRHPSALRPPGRPAIRLPGRVHDGPTVSERKPFKNPKCKLQICHVECGPARVTGLGSPGPSAPPPCTRRPCRDPFFLQSFCAVSNGTN